MVKKQDKGGSIDLGAVAAPVILYGLRSLMTPDTPVTMKKKPSGKRRFTKGGAEGEGEGQEQQPTPAVACPAPAAPQPVAAPVTYVPPAGVAPSSPMGGKSDKKKGGMRDLLDRLLQRGGENGMMVANQEVAPPVMAPPATGGEVVGAVDVTSLMGVEGTVEGPASVPGGMEGGKKMKKRASAKKQRGGKADDQEQRGGKADDQEQRGGKADDQEQQGGKKMKKRSAKKQRGGDDDMDADQLLEQQGGKKMKKRASAKKQRGGDDDMDADQLLEQQGGKKMKKRASAKKQRGGDDDMDADQLLEQAGGKKKVKKSTKGGALDMYAQQLDQIMKGLQGMM